AGDGSRERERDVDLDRLAGLRQPGHRRAAVVIAYIEGGINWHHGDARELADKVYLNRGELPPPLCDRSPCANPGSYDANGDGVFNAADYASDGRVSDFNGNGLIDPEDVITAFTCYDR